MCPLCVVSGGLHFLKTRRKKTPIDSKKVFEPRTYPHCTSWVSELILESLYRKVWRELEQQIMLTNRTATMTTELLMVSPLMLFSCSSICSINVTLWCMFGYDVQPTRLKSLRWKLQNRIQTSVTGNQKKEL